MVLDAEGNLTDAMRLENKSAGKGSRSGGVVYMSERLKASLAELSSPVSKTHRHHRQIKVW